MHTARLVILLLGIVSVQGGPLRIYQKRQEDGVTTTAAVDGGDGGTGGHGGDTPTSAPDSGNNGSQTTTADESTSTAPSDNNDGGGGEGTDDCAPCTDPYPTYRSPSGKTCYCLGNGDRAKWEWTTEGHCINDSEGLPNDEDRPSFCLGTGGVPGSRACLSGCNFMLNTVNSANPCNPNLYNAASSCASCVGGGAIHYQLDGKSRSPPYIQDQSSMNTFLGGLKDWCSKPNRCIDLSSGAKLSGNGCPQLSVGGSFTTVSNPGGSRSPSTNDNKAGSTSIPPKIVTSATITTTGSDGRPSFSIELMTIDNPAFTANTEFATARATGGTDGTGAATVSSGTSLVTMLASIVLLAFLQNC